MCGIIKNNPDKYLIELKHLDYRDYSRSIPVEYFNSKYYKDIEPNNLRGQDGWYVQMYHPYSDVVIRTKVSAQNYE